MFSDRQREWWLNVFKPCEVKCAVLSWFQNRGSIERAALSAAPQELGRAAHCPIAAIPISLWYHQCRLQFVGF